MDYNVKLLNSKSVLECNEEEYEKHNKELFNIIGRLENISNYQCALICKYQDPANMMKEQEILSSDLRNILCVTEMFDCSNGMDILLDEDSYLCMMLYGQKYTRNNTSYVVTVAIKVMPYDKYRNFIDISGVVENDGVEQLSREQYDYNPLKMN